MRLVSAQYVHHHPFHHPFQHRSRSSRSDKLVHRIPSKAREASHHGIVHSFVMVETCFRRFRSIQVSVGCASRGILRSSAADERSSWRSDALDRSEDGLPRTIRTSNAPFVALGRLFAPAAVSCVRLGTHVVASWRMMRSPQLQETRA